MAIARAHRVFVGPNGGMSGSAQVVWKQMVDGLTVPAAYDRGFTQRTWDSAVFVVVVTLLCVTLCRLLPIVRLVTVVQRWRNCVRFGHRRVTGAV